jgi:hypothetical protein
VISRDWTPTRISLLTAAWLLAATPALAAPGPGIGNIDCTEAERFKPLAFLDSTQGGPTASNVVIMTGGYLVLNFAQCQRGGTRRSAGPIY